MIFKSTLARIFGMASMASQSFFFRIQKFVSAGWSACLMRDEEKEHGILLRFKMNIPYHFPTYLHQI
jgi:hypothetical protein